jgi:hypothetical protein
MRRSRVVIITAAALVWLMGSSWGKEVSPQTVKNACGKTTTTYPDGTTGCQKCTTGHGGQCVDYNCRNNKCTSVVVRENPSGLKGGLLDSSSGLTTQGPGATGTPLKSATPPPPPPVQLR